MGLLGLSLAGLIIATSMGAITYLVGGLNYLLLLLVFLIVSLYITTLGYRFKAKLGIYDYERGVPNVISNGIFPTIFAIMGMPTAFIGSVAAITADKFASELGTLSQERPIEVITWKRVKRGKSGAITSLGTFASFVGALTISFIAIHLFQISPFQAFLLSISGFLGSVADTLAGYFEERGIGSKETSNLICSLIGGIVALWLLGG